MDKLFPFPLPEAVQRAAKALPTGNNTKTMTDNHRFKDNSNT